MEDCAEIGENARNSRLFLQACRCESWEDVKRVIAPHVVIEVSWRDVSSSACMVVRLLQSLLGGGTKGKGYKEERAATPNQFMKALRGHLVEHPCHTSPRVAREERESAITYKGFLFMAPNEFCASRGLKNVDSAPGAAERASVRKRLAVFERSNYDRGEMLVCLVSPNRSGRVLKDAAGDFYDAPNHRNSFVFGSDITPRHLAACTAGTALMLYQLPALWRTIGLASEGKACKK